MLKNDPISKLRNQFQFLQFFTKTDKVYMVINISFSVYLSLSLNRPRNLSWKRKIFSYVHFVHLCELIDGSSRVKVFLFSSSSLAVARGSPKEYV